MASGLQSSSSMRGLLILSLILVGPGAAAAEWSPLRLLQQKLAATPLAQARARACLIRSCRALHAELRDVRLPLPESQVLSTEAARAKTYGASWTCRESSRLLIQRLSTSGQKLQLDSSGKNAFEWGNEGLVSFHYYAVDTPSRPRLLVDPTALSNFAMDVQPGGLLRQYLEEAGRDLGKPAAAQRVLGRMLGGRSGDLLVLSHPSEIDVYREALERAANRLRSLSRDAERSSR